jgi:hypothetical protein
MNDNNTEEIVIAVILITAKARVTPTKTESTMRF